MATTTLCLSSVHAAVLQQHLCGALWSTHGGELPHSPLVSLSLYVSTGGLLWLSDGGSSGQQTGEVTESVCCISSQRLIVCCAMMPIQTCDRKGTLLFNNVFSIVPAVMMGVSEIAKSYEIIIVARFIVGICAGQRTSHIHHPEVIFYNFPFLFKLCLQVCRPTWCQCTWESSLPRT